MNYDPTLESALSRPLTFHERELLEHLNRLKFFLATAPARWTHSPSSSHTTNTPGDDPMSHPALNRFLLPNMEYVSCVLWDGLYHITGTDIVRALVFRFEAFGRPVRNMKKFEEGVFSDLRNLKPGVDACLEEPKSPFLELLFKYQCIRTQKKQKVFYWYDYLIRVLPPTFLTLYRFSVPHDRLFLDALERDLKRERQGLEPTTMVTGEPAQSFRYTYDPKRSLYEQFSEAQGRIAGEGELEAAVRAHELELEGERVSPMSFSASSSPGPGGSASRRGGRRKWQL
ncbi:STE-domain-containing protein [Daedalea quercina L-15889]|uniref:STE-domain-containing protein n=1 Tax=Daedalea quercina L-15889 TaxID=1314783 RepID=A0A165RMX5_9APHY|nr:STE-domain-containing protein [Daedalea quercina L-15889]